MNLAQLFFTVEGRGFEQLQRQVAGAGKSLTNVGSILTENVSKPLAKVAVSAVKTATDFDQQMSRVKAVTGTTGKDFDLLRNQAVKMGSSTSKTATESAEALEYMGLAGWSLTDMQKGLEPMLRASEAGMMDLGLTSDLVTDSMSALGIGTKDMTRYLDIGAKAQNTSNQSMQQFLEAMVTAGGSFKMFNTPLEEAGALLGILANRGYKGSEAGNAMISIMANLTTGTGKAGDAMRSLGIEVYDKTGKFRGMTTILKELNGKFDGMTEAQKNTYIQMIGGKTRTKELNALLNGTNEELDDLTGKLYNSDGALSDMARTMQDNFAGEITKLKSTLEGIAISIGDRLMPYIRKLTSLLQGLANWFNGLDGRIKDVIIVLGLLAIAIPPIIMAVGMLMTAFGGVATGVGAVVPAIGAFAGALSLPAILTAGAVIAGIGVACYGIAQGMKPAIEQVEVLGEGVSKTTKTALKGVLELNEKASNTLTEYQIKQTEITKQTGNNLRSIYDQYTNEIVNKIKNKNQQILSDETKLFKDSEILTAQEEAKILEKTTQYNNNKILKVQENNRKIKEIITQAEKEKRELTQQEYKKIESIQKSSLDTTVKQLTDNEVEQKVIFERIKNNADIMTTEEAVKVIKNSVKQREKVIKEADNMYYKKIATITRLRDEAGVLSQEEANKLMKEAKKERDGTVKQAEKRHSEIVDEAEQQMGDHVKVVDTETGKILSKWEVFGNNVASKGKSAMDKLIGAITPAVKSITTMMSNALGDVLSINNSVSSAKKQSDRLQKIKSNNESFAAYATGIKNSPHDHWAIVGEQGPELQYIPKGSSIYTATETKRLLNQSRPNNNYSNSSANINKSVNLYGDVVIDAKSVKDFNDVVEVLNNVKRYKAMN